MMAWLDRELQIVSDFADASRKKRAYVHWDDPTPDDIKMEEEEDLFNAFESGNVLRVRQSLLRALNLPPPPRDTCMLFLMDTRLPTR